MSRATLPQAKRLLGKICESNLSRPEVQIIIRFWSVFVAVVAFLRERGKDGATLLAAWLVEQLEQVDAVMESIVNATRMTDTVAMRIAQATMLWKKFEAVLREIDPDLDSLAKYLASIPEVPTFPAEWGDTFDRTVLCDYRIIATVGLKRFCEILGVGYDGADDTFVAFDPAQTENGVEWVRCQDGHRNRDRKPTDCRTTFAAFEVGATFALGLFLFAQDAAVIGGDDNHVMDLPGSVHAVYRAHVAYLWRWGGRVGLSWGFGVSAAPQFGSVSRGSGKTQPSDLSLSSSRSASSA